MIVVVITCKDKEEATKIGKALLTNKLAACIKVTSDVRSMYLWPPKSEKIEEATEVMLLCKTLESKWSNIEKEVITLHSYKTPEIYALPASRVSQKYLDWITGELS